MKKTDLRYGKKIKIILKDKMHVDYPSVDTDLLTDGYLNSLSFVNMLSLLEEEFGINVETEDIDYKFFRTPRDIDAFVQRKMMYMSRIEN